MRTAAYLYLGSVIVITAMIGWYAMYVGARFEVVTGPSVDAFFRVDTFTGQVDRCKLSRQAGGFVCRS